MENNNFTIGMNEKLNIELVKMQEELNLLDIAIKHIGKAETISKVVVEASRGIPQRIDKHLKEVLEKYNNYLGESKAETKTQIDTLTASHQNLVSKAETTIGEYKVLAEETEKRSVANHKQALDSYIAFVNKTYNQQEERLDDLVLAQNKQIKRAEDSLSEYRQIAEATEKRSLEILSSGLLEYREYLEKNRADFKEKVDGIMAVSNEHLDENKQIANQLQASHQNSVEEMNSVIADYRILGEKIETQSKQHLEKALAEYRNYLEAVKEQANVFMDKLTQLHVIQLQEVKQLTDNSAQLSKVSSELMKRIEDIDFPTRLSQIDKNTSNILSKSAKNADDILLAVESALQKQQFSSSENKEQLDKRLEAQDKELKIMKIGIAILGAFSLITLLLLLLGK